MGDLDINLIKEFAARPEFYDRSNIRFKDKAYIQQSWQEIAFTLGYDAHLLKDRMLQLRNRYNLEKRRLEAYRMGNPKKLVESPWTLFNHMQFLDRHIRPRRSYKTMMRRNLDSDNMVPIEDPTSLLCLQDLQSPSQFPNSDEYRSADVKYESDVESGDDCHLSDSGNYTVEDSQGANETMSTDAVHNEPLPAGLSVRKVESLKRKYSAEESQYQSPRKYQKAPQFEKFETFGKFLSISLCELPEEKALVLIEKFTSDIIKVMLDSKRTSPEKSST